MFLRISSGCKTKMRCGKACDGLVVLFSFSSGGGYLEKYRNKVFVFRLGPSPILILIVYFHDFASPLMR